MLKFSALLVRFLRYVFSTFFRGLIRVPAVAVIIENTHGEILMLLRDDRPDISYPNHWSLAGGRVERGESPEKAAHRELLEEIGVDLDLSLWKRYDRQHPPLIVDQHIYLGKIDLPLESLTLGEGQSMRFFKQHEMKGLKIAFEFDALLDQYFLKRP
jgi:8-oxo-dGTP diphosphatase